MKLDNKFYQRDVHIVARELLGKIFVRKIQDKYLKGRIVEVEAYDGSIDEAAHSFSGRTKRNEVMFQGGGLLYVYFTYGMHFCANVVTGKLDEGKAILIRGIEPKDGIEFMSINRFDKKIVAQKEKINLANGPAKICQAFQLDKNDNGTSLLSDDIYILDAPIIPKTNIITAKRIGIKKSVDLPWRYYIKGNPFVSNYSFIGEKK
jgi:DNA-3-methyladenine glycosylase